MSTDIKRAKAATTMVDLVAKSKGTLIAPREIIQKIETLSPIAVQTLEDLMINAKAESVKLKAALEILGLAGITKETKVSIKTEVHDMDEKEINNRLSELLGKAQGVVAEAEYEEIEDADQDNEDAEEEVHAG
jgi:hypothetical protein